MENSIIITFLCIRLISFIFITFYTYLEIIEWKFVVIEKLNLYSDIIIHSLSYSLIKKYICVY